MMIPLMSGQWRYPMCKNKMVFQLVEVMVNYFLTEVSIGIVSEDLLHRNLNELILNNYLLNKNCDAVI